MLQRLITKISHIPTSGICYIQALFSSHKYSLSQPFPLLQGSIMCSENPVYQDEILLSPFCLEDQRHSPHSATTSRKRPWEAPIIMLNILHP